MAAIGTILSTIFTAIKYLPELIKIFNSLVKAWKEYKERQHEEALKRLKDAKTKEDIEKATRDLARNP